ncbi:hypothetical protein AB0454_41375 [Streptomyces sp. NPDC093509]|uniref:hypothetical protein n=1 Tax=Streptomyces sp. NPDC093509 TaxID=3154982 RepID=UPI00344D99B8
MITTATGVRDVTEMLGRVEGIPPGAGHSVLPRTRPEALLGDKGYDSTPYRDDLRKPRIMPVISTKAPRTSRARDKLRSVGERTFVLLHHFKQLAI